MRRATLILLAVVAVLIAVALVYQRHLYHQATYQGKFAREWAVELTVGPDPTNRAAATAAFQAMGANAVPELRRMLRSKDPFYAKAVMNYQRRLSPVLRQYVLKKAGGGEAINMHIMGARALGCVGPAAKDAVPDLIATLHGWELEARWAAAAALGKIGAAAVPALIAATSDPDLNIRHAAVCALGTAGTAAGAAAPALFDRMSDTNENIRASALDSFSRIGSAALPVVLTNFTSAQPGARDTAAQALLAIGPAARVVWPQLKTLSTNESPVLRRQAFELMLGLRFFNTNAVKIYTAALDDVDSGVRIAAIKALSEVGVKAQPALIPRLQDAEEPVRIAARAALEKIATATTNAP